MLLGLQLNLRPFGVNTGRQSRSEAVCCLLIDRFGAFHLGLGSNDPGLRRDQLQVAAAHRQHHQVAGVAGAQAACLQVFVRAAEVVDAHQIEDRLIEPSGAPIDVIELDRLRDDRDRNAECAQIFALKDLTDSQVQVWQQGALGDRTQPLCLLHRRVLLDTAQVESHPALQGIVQRERKQIAGDWAAGCAAVIRRQYGDSALNGVDGVATTGVGGALHHRHSATALHRRYAQRVLRCAGGAGDLLAG